LLLAFFTLVLLAPCASAHRLDEYLQATQISVGKDRIVVDIYLTPGTTVAPAILTTIDKNRDGSISSEERVTYGQSVLKSVRLLIDDKPRELSLLSGDYPPMEQMGAGIGMIHLKLATSARTDSEGVHALIFENRFDSGESVYLANAMLPLDRAVTINHQQRDVLQRNLQIDYEIGIVRADYYGSAWTLVALVVSIGSVRYWLYRSTAAKGRSAGSTSGG
jgi:hypothetical protein